MRFASAVFVCGFSLFLVGCHSKDSENAATPTYTVVATAGSGGSIAPANAEVAEGATAIFTLIPEPGYGIGPVTGCDDNGSLSGDQYTTGPITTACTLTASFTMLSSLNAPENLQAAPGGGAVTLTWDAVSGAVGYNVFYGLTPGINIDTAASYDDVLLDQEGPTSVLSGLVIGTPYYFVVTATDGAAESLPSAEVSATPGPLTKADLEAFACLGQQNGHHVAAGGNDGDVYVGVFSGSNGARGKLHRVLRDGTVFLDINPIMPWGISDLVRSLDGRLLALGSGGATFPNWDHIITELDIETGATTETLYEQPMDSDGEFFYSRSLTAGLDGTLYFNKSGNPSKIVEVNADGNAITLWGTGVNGKLAMAPDGVTIWNTSGSLYSATEGSADPTLRHQYTDGSGVVGLTFDSQGILWLGGGSSDGVFIDKYDPATGDIIRVVELDELDVALAGPSYDPGRREIVFWVGTTDQVQGVDCAVPGVFYAIGVE